MAPRPIRPHPRHFRPIVYGGYEFNDFGLVFGFGFWDLAYWDWNPSSWRATPGTSQPILMLYLTDGSAYEVTDYWVDGDTMNYETEDGTVGAISLGSLDLQRTTDANARLGFQFRLDRAKRGLPFEKISSEAGGVGATS
ncbi:MAG TPA: hypothetical protein VLY23_18335 [Candidatus Acidoferrum sp.]|nr:hypothetical protein [Candidatus Acidoferrum sp.]